MVHRNSPASRKLNFKNLYLFEKPKGLPILSGLTLQGGMCSSGTSAILRLLSSIKYTAQL